MDKLLIRIARAFGFKIAQQRKDFHNSCQGAPCTLYIVWGSFNLWHFYANPGAALKLHR